MSSTASKASFRRCSETCQKVRAEISDAIEHQLETMGIDLSSATIAALTDAAFDAALEHGTGKLRAALIECEDELIEAREVLETTEDELKDAKRTIDDLEDEVSFLESDLDTARSS
jgi:uncharacterized membrane protein YqiK